MFNICMRKVGLMFYKLWKMIFNVVWYSYNNYAILESVAMFGTWCGFGPNICPQDTKKQIVCARPAQNNIYFDSSKFNVGWFHLMHPSPYNKWVKFHHPYLYNFNSYRFLYLQLIYSNHFRTANSNWLHCHFNIVLVRL